MTTVLVASGGGHLQELVALAPRLGIEGRIVWAAPDSGLSRDLLKGKEHFVLPYYPPRDLKGSLSLTRLAHSMLTECEAERIVSTGALPAPPFFLAGAAKGLDLHYIESVARSSGPSLAGRLVSSLPMAHLYTQYPAWATKRWSYAGSVFDPYHVESTAVESPLRRVVVTLGTECYSFRRAVVRLLQLLPRDTQVLWQTGATPVDDLGINGHKLVPATELRNAIAAADLVICHAGAGSAHTAFDLGKVPLLLPRRAKHGEHVDDHQTLIARELGDRNLALSVDADQLELKHLDEARAGRIVRDDIVRPVVLQGSVPHARRPATAPTGRRSASATRGHATDVADVTTPGDLAATGPATARAARR